PPEEFYWFTLPIISLIVVFLLTYFQLVSKMIEKIEELTALIIWIEGYAEEISGLKDAITDLRISLTERDSVEVRMKKLGVDAKVETLDVSDEGSCFRILLPSEFVLRSPVYNLLEKVSKRTSCNVGSAYIELGLSEKSPEECATILIDFLTNLDSELSEAIKWRSKVEARLKQAL
ncbi:MAG: hypothetical protein QMC85_03965, partial [Methanocellales archaeon]|nr:hypothetical protein [Methanocellales archaeon]